ncbi:hypothetical protein FACS1894211_06080 [Clostridia bacterium]|nr:hypothetical protein FACS1894211_06080 [Clostridia bacterium]
MKKFLWILLALVFCLPLLTACNTDGGGGKTEPPPETRPGRIIEREKYFYGLGEPGGIAVDGSANLERLTTLAGEVGIQSYRMWMHTGGDLVAITSQNVVSLVPAKVQYYHGFIAALKAKGITNIIAMSHYYRFPSGFPQNENMMGAYPAPDSPYYERFMKIVEDTYALLTAEFPEVKYWECGNEINVNAYCHKVGGYWNNTNDTSKHFMLTERAQIGADLMYSATKGMKAGNPNAVSVMPGLVFNNDNSLSQSAQGIRPYLRTLYGLIESGACPSVGAESSTKTDDYFEVLNWHPYNFNGVSTAGSAFTMLNDSIYEIVKDHGDDGKKVFFTEYGYTTTEGNNIDPTVRASREQTQGGYIAQDMKNIWANLPYVEIVVIFRMYDWEAGQSELGPTIEMGFGLFTDPAMSTGPRPKKIAIELQKAIKGANVDSTGLYKYYTAPETGGGDQTGGGGGTLAPMGFYGLGEPGGAAVDGTENLTRLANLAGEVGIQSYRMWMHTGNDLVTVGSTNGVSLVPAKVTYYHTFIDALKAKGVTNFIAMSHYYRFPYGSGLENEWTFGMFPAPGSTYYAPFLKIVEDTYKLLTAEFPDVKYWECGNEINDNMYCHKSGGYWNNTGDNSKYYTIDEKAQIGVDLMYAATKGMKAGNPNAVSVMPGLVFDNSISTASASRGIRPFLTKLYGKIESGNSPSVGSVRSTDADDYFEVLNWHPYNFGGNSSASSSFTQLNLAVYQIAKDHGDDGKKVFFTEFGYTTTENGILNTDTAARENREQIEGGFIAADMLNIRTHLTFVATVIIFRMYDWEGAAQESVASNIEIGFGLFTDPTLSVGPRPKKIAVELQKAIKGADIDRTELFLYFTGTVPNWL